MILKSVSHIYPYVDTGIVSISRRISTGMMTDFILVVFNTINREFRVPISGEITGLNQRSG